MKVFQCFSGQPQKTRHFERRSRPKAPQRAQQRGKSAEVESRAGKRTGERVKAQLPAADAQREREQGRREQRAVSGVERICEPWIVPAPRTQRAKQVVEQRQRHAQQNRGGKRAQLSVNAVCHSSAAEQA
ncbi:MAG: hypothetical protein IJU66_02500 [Oscillospiraceae bacterium]|nr:hypothetical protein [Oscillospiraceae bacterium]